MWCRSSKLEPTASLLLPAAAAVLVRDDDFLSVPGHELGVP